MPYWHFTTVLIYVTLAFEPKTGINTTQSWNTRPLCHPGYLTYLPYALLLIFLNNPVRLSRELN